MFLCSCRHIRRSIGPSQLGQHMPAHHVAKLVSHDQFCHINECEKPYILLGSAKENCGTTVNSDHFSMPDETIIYIV